MQLITEENTKFPVHCKDEIIIVPFKVSYMFMCVRGSFQITLPLRCTCGMHSAFIAKDRSV